MTKCTFENSIKSDFFQNLKIWKSDFSQNPKIRKYVFKISNLKNLKIFKNQNPKIKSQNLKSENNFPKSCQINFSSFFLLDQLFFSDFFKNKFDIFFPTKHIQIFFWFPSEKYVLSKFQGKCDLRFPSHLNPSFVVSTGLTKYSIY